MKYLFGLIVFLSVIYINLAAVAIALPNKDHPNKCVIGDKLYDPGTYHPENSCSEINCGLDFTAKIFTCGALQAQQGFRIERDQSKIYPDCCGKPVKINGK